MLVGLALLAMVLGSWLGWFAFLADLELGRLPGPRWAWMIAVPLAAFLALGLV